ncbi:MAG: hypothetical protein ACJ70M_01375 [Nitrososphaera sp.]
MSYDKYKVTLKGEGESGRTSPSVFNRYYLTSLQDYLKDKVLPLAAQGLQRKIENGRG